MPRVRTLLLALLTLSTGGTGAIAITPEPVECAPRLACMSAPHWACIGGGVSFDRCNEGVGSDPFDVVCQLM